MTHYNTKKNNRKQNNGKRFAKRTNFKGQTIDVESIKSYKNSVTGDIIDFDNTYVSSSLIIIVELDEE